MHDANEMECLIFENAIKNILLGKVTKSGVSDANNKLIITIFQMWGHIDPIRSGIGLNHCYMYVFLFVILDDEYVRLSLLCLINKVL